MIQIDVLPNPSSQVAVDFIFKNWNLFPLQDVRIACFEDGVEVQKGPVGELPIGPTLTFTPAAEIMGRTHRYREIGFRQKARFRYMPVALLTSTDGLSVRPRLIRTPDDLKRLDKAEVLIKPKSLYMVVVVRYKRSFFHLMKTGDAESRFSFVAEAFPGGGYKWRNQPMDFRIPAVIEIRSKSDPKDASFRVLATNPADSPQTLDLKVSPAK